MSIMKTSLYLNLAMQFNNIIFQLILIYGGIPYLWRVSGDVLQNYGYDSSYEVNCLNLQSA